MCRSLQNGPRNMRSQAAAWGDILLLLLPPTVHPARLGCLSGVRCLPPPQENHSWACSKGEEVIGVRESWQEVRRLSGRPVDRRMVGVGVCQGRHP